MPDCLDAHLSWCVQRNLRPVYVTNRRRTLTLIESQVGVPLDSADPAELNQWYQWLIDQVTPESRRVMLVHLCSFYDWMVEAGRRPDNPARKLPRPRTKRRLPRPIPTDQLRRALDTAPTDDVRLFLSLAAFEGMRAIEIAHLRGEDLTFGPNPILVVRGKGDKERIVPMHPEVERLLQGRPRRGYLFLRPRASGPILPWRVCAFCNDHLHSLGIDSTLHTLRHWFGTETYRASQDLRLTQELLGHSDPATTAGYAAYSPDRSAGIVSSLSA